MSWKLDDNKPVYLQLMEEIKHRILIGQYKSGSKLPAVRELALEASVNPNTMQRAMADLEREGLIYTERTSGRFVTEDIKMINQLKDNFAKEIVENFVETLFKLGFTKEEIINAVAATAKE